MVLWSRDVVILFSLMQFIGLERKRLRRHRFLVAWNVWRFATGRVLLLLLVFLPAVSETSAFLILKVSQYGGSRWWIQLFPRFEKWYPHFYKTYNHQIWKVGTSTEVDSNETNQASAGEIMWQTIETKKISPLPECIWPPNLVGW